MGIQIQSPSYSKEDIVNTLSSSQRGLSARRIVLVIVALSVTTLLTVTVSTDAFAWSNGRTVASSMESEIDSIPGSSGNSDSDSSLEGPLMASDPTIVVTDSLKGPLTDSTADPATDSVDQSPLKGPLN